VIESTEAVEAKPETEYRRGLGPKLEASISRLEQKGLLFDREAFITVDPGMSIRKMGVNVYLVAGREANGKVPNIAINRFMVAQRIGRPLQRSEMVRFKEANTDFRSSNLVLKSRLATSHEMYLANGMVLGYSHCLCGCGIALDLEAQKIRPHAFMFGHSPARKNLSEMEEPTENNDHGAAVRESTKLASLAVDLGVIPEPVLSTVPTEGELMEEEKPSSPVLAYRRVFEAVIASMPDEDFEKLLPVIQEIYNKSCKERR